MVCGGGGGRLRFRAISRPPPALPTGPLNPTYSLDQRHHAVVVDVDLLHRGLALDSRQCLLVLLEELGREELVKLIPALALRPEGGPF